MEKEAIQVHYITSKAGLKAALVEALNELNLLPVSDQVEVKPPATRREACEFLNISLPTLDTLIRTNQIPSFCIGRQVRIRWTDLESYVNQQ